MQNAVLVRLTVWCTCKIRRYVHINFEYDNVDGDDAAKLKIHVCKNCYLYAQYAVIYTGLVLLLDAKTLRHAVQYRRAKNDVPRN